jgi:hypothetical protein
MTTKTFIGFRHLESCNNLKDQKGGTGLDKDLDPGASMWGVLQGLCISSQNEGLLVNDEKMSVDVHVSCLVRTWMTAILIYLPLTGVLHLKISPFLKETDQGEKAPIGLNTGNKRVDLGNMPENRFAQLRKIKRFLKTLFQMGEVLDDKITSNQWICNKINAMKGKKIVIELLGDKSYQPITIDTNNITVSLVPASKTRNKEGAEIIRPVPSGKTALNPLVLALDYPPLDTDNDAKYTENFKNYVIHIAKLFNQQIMQCEPATSSVIEPATSSVIEPDDYNEPFVAKQGGNSGCPLPLKEAVIKAVNIPNQKMKTESAGDFESAYADFTKNTGEIETKWREYINDIGDYNKSHFKSDVGAFIEFAFENDAKKIHFVAHNDILKTYVKKMFIPEEVAKAKVVEPATSIKGGNFLLKMFKKSKPSDEFSTLFKTSSSGENKQNIWNLILKTEMGTIDRIEESGTRSDPQIYIEEVTIKSGIEKMKDSKMQTISACENLCTFDTLSNVANVFSEIGTRYSASLGNRKPDRIQKCTTEQVAKKIAKNETTTAKKGWFSGGKKRTRRLASKGKRHKSRRNYTKK